ncbi:PREDICTED: ADP-ribosylation factor-like protein 13B [Ceratosolen solmsi marchali]|uniref:ADP-ribosylation factor-like protein 13B n=1 Tax=Ceratosolen solmsi marchali TaxID=326594 RepID=A0AAJ6YGW2_9HYME|nr:PREDICTED: ADP-ribosylation factor-like protein 13B [Ceratosolen solmsi marchali]
MGNCISATIVACMGCAWKQCSCRRKVKKSVVLLVVGLDNAGKSAVVNYLFNKSFLTKEKVVPTIGFRTVTFNFKSCSIKLYDIGGGPQIRALWPKYYGDVHGVIYVVDANDHDRLSESANIFQELACHELIKQKPILFLGNKQDLHHAIDEFDIIQYMNISSVVNFAKCYTRVEICSCYPDKHKYFNLNKNIDKGFGWLIEVIKTNYDDIEKELHAKRSKKNPCDSFKINSWTAQSLAHSFIYSDTDSETYLKPIIPDDTEYKRRKRRKRRTLNNIFCISNNRTGPLPDSTIDINVPTTKTMRELIKSIKIEDLINNTEIDADAILSYRRPRRWSKKRPSTAPPGIELFEVHPVVKPHIITSSQ